MSITVSFKVSSDERFPKFISTVVEQNDKGEYIAGGTIEDMIGHIEVMSVAKSISFVEHLNHIWSFLATISQKKG